jgi:alkylation response protein AidB-like acyl-CoA dehydrogenase
MFNLHLSPEQLEFRDTVRDFVEKRSSRSRSRPTASTSTTDPAGRVLRKATDGASHAGAARGFGRRRRRRADLCIVTEELAVGDADVAAVLTETSALGLQLFSPQ